VFLGIEAGIALFAIDYSDRDAPPDFGAPDAAFAEIRPVAASLVSTDAALLAQARGLLHWRRMHRFCGQCGAPMRVAEGGHKLVCTAHPEHLNFPRTDPVVIMLVRRGDQALLARGTRFPPDSRTLSALAGFIEPGESAEEAVAREVFEEVGLRLSGVRYHSSQPWPFPGSLMLGFDALAEDGALAIDPTEIAEARWLTRAQVRAHAALGFDVPGPAAIARRLISDWLAEDGGPGLGDLS
jgi:NAD+ diphosphatase